MAASCSDSQALSERSEGEAETEGNNEGKDSSQKSIQEVSSDENMETSKHCCEEEINGEESKVLEKALKEASRLGSRKDPMSQDPSDVSAPLQGMFIAIIDSRVPIRSQQIGEPEFSHEQKMAMLLDLYKSKPLVFLERFRKVIKEEHLQCFCQLSDDYTADFYFKEIRKASLKKVHHTRVRNKRYAALQQLISGGEYFSDEEMRKRDPLMYEHYVGQYQSEEEIMSQNSLNMCQANTLTDVFLNSCQEQITQRKLEVQRELEENCEEEEEDSSEEEDAELPSDEERIVDSEERALMREEFVSRMYQSFLDGKDKHFDYSEVDDNPEFDNLDIVTRDEEERYFDDDDESMEQIDAEEELGEKGQTVESSAV